MSWPVASFAIVIAALLGCFWWYERSRPPAKVVAVVATLAALAALGRDAFVALPDVKPTTTIALVAGFAFGGEVGFAVGATSALASNVLLGQGPWTPWQMLGWGLVGIAGALLARATRGRVGRLGLAVACALAAEGFNLVMNLFTWTTGAAHTAAAYGLLLSGALAFDITHVVASFVFGFAFGPALVRMLARVRARLEVSWRPITAVPPPAVLLLALVLAAAGTLAQGNARAATPASLSRQVSFLVSSQNGDGGFGAARGQSSSELYTAWAAMGLAAAGRDPSAVRRGGRSVLDALRAGAGALSGAGDLERTILALHASGASVHSLPGGDPVARLLRRRSANGSFGQLVNLTAFGVFSLRAAGFSPADSRIVGAVRWLQGAQGQDGGYSPVAGGPSDVDDTAAALQALALGGARSGGTATRAMRFLLSQQNSDGGFPLQPGSPSNAQSTAFAAQALVAAGRSPALVHRHGSRSPVAYLRSLIAPDGSVRYSRTSGQTPVWVTGQALLALAGRPFPIPPVAHARRSAAPPPATAHAVPRARAHPAAPPGRARGATRRPRTERSAPAAPAAAAARADALALGIGRLAGMALGPMVS